MLKILLFGGIGVAVILLCVLGMAAMKPARFTISRSITIRAAPEKVQPLINDLHRWEEWSEKDKNEATITRTYRGAPAGKGAVYEWEGKGSAGKGRIEILESSLHLVRLQADWTRPFAARNFNTFAIEPQEGSTRVTWTLDGENVFMLRVMMVFVSAERLMGSHMETGLAGLKAAAEK